MILFAPCKINIGLDVMARRDDGYHDIETLMVPVGSLCDIVEAVPTVDADGVEFTNSGLKVDCLSDNNLCVKAWELMRSEYGIGGAKIHLHKKIPFGAGLGGGSSDAAYTLKVLNAVFGLGLDISRLEELGARLGSDVPFFMRNESQLAKGRGEILEPYPLELSGYHILIIKPPVHVSTAEAYGGIKPCRPQTTLEERLMLPVERWRDEIHNAFEDSAFEAYPLLAQIKKQIYSSGAVYASMSGSGSAVYGLFRQAPALCGWSGNYVVHAAGIE